MDQVKYLRSIDQSLKVIASELTRMNQSQSKQAKDFKQYKGVPPDGKVPVK